MKLKLHRDKVVSMTEKGDLVGVYVLVIKKAMVSGNHKYKEFLLAEMSPKKADKIISLWNSK